MVTTIYQKNNSILNIDELSKQYPELIKNPLMANQFIALKTILTENTVNDFTILVDYDTNSIRFSMDVNP